MIFISILTLIVAKALPVLNTNISSLHFTRITSIVFLITGYLIINSLNLQSLGSGLGIYSGLFHITQITQLLEIFLFLIGGLILMGWPQIKTKINKLLPSVAWQENYSTDYSLIVLFSSLGSALLISSYDLISLYLSIELQSFGLYVLSTLYRDSESSTAAGLKYFLLGGLASCIILLGAGIVYSYTGITNFESLYLINSISDINQQYIIQGLSLGLILIFVGFLFKMAAAPLHNWSPDVYDGTPTIVTIWLTIIPKISILIILLELQTKLGIIGDIIPLLNTDLQYFIPFVEGYPAVKVVDLLNNIQSIGAVQAAALIKNLLLISSLLSLIIGSLLGLAQTKIKRLLAYSTISHIGFLLLALAINSEQSIDSFIFYILQYTITNLNIFLIILALTYLNNNKNNNKYTNSSEGGANQAGTIVRDLTFIIEFKNLFFSNPFLSLSLGVSLFSLAGVPPLIGFFSKQFVLYSSLQDGYYFISIIAIIVSVISASYYLKIIKLLFTQLDSDSSNELNSISNIENENKIILTNTHSFIISTLTLFIILFFIKPSIILNSTQLLSLSLFYI
uniref:NADH-ubiquinone oxidoreductase chain 2 n=1 Tax=Gymnopilus junonius TaxID=109634 RepID=A0A890JDK0_GYMJU|nr:NADH dehydrogenase subunit 2 [Gymnopilus junonius]QRH17751.1 NADH dehydrogenase subunit 2 [Gymnopilus junonius]